VPVGGEALSAGGAADQRRGGGRADALFSEQVGSQVLDLSGQFVFQRPFGAGQLADAPQLVARDPDPRGLRQTLQASRDAVKRRVTVQAADRKTSFQIGI
jgi:hypothetical protein